MRNNQYRQEEINKMRELYSRCHNMSQVSRQLKISISTVRKYVLSDINSSYTIAEDNKIIELLKEDRTIKSIAKELNKDPETIARIARKNNIKKKKSPKSKLENENYFDNIDTEKKAYYLGWIMADGCISLCNGYSLKIGISANDKQLIYNFLNELGSKHSIKIKQSNKGGLTAYTSIGSKHLVNSLIKLGVIPNKSEHESVPDISVDLLPQFYRGYFDGDGTVSDSYN